MHADTSNDDGDPVGEQVWIMDANGAHKQQLTFDALEKDQEPDWSPDGSKIAYSSGDPGSGGTWVMNADGSNQHQLSGCVAGDPQPCPAGDEFGVAWSPDGTKIAFLRDLSLIGISDRPVFVMNADGSDQHRITTAPIIPGVPALAAAPRGRRLSFVRIESLPGHRRTMPGQGSCLSPGRRSTRRPPRCPSRRRGASRTAPPGPTRAGRRRPAPRRRAPPPPRPGPRPPRGSRSGPRAAP